MTTTTTTTTEKKTYKITFTARKIGAIGKAAKFTKIIKAATEEAASIVLYDNFEHITGAKFKVLSKLGADIERLKIKENLKTFAESKIQGIKFNCNVQNEFYTKRDKCIIDKSLYIYPADASEFKTVLKAFKPSNTYFIEGGKNTRVETPYRITIDNPAAYGRTIKIQWEYNDILIYCTLPEALISDFLERTTRGVYDSEHHYFTGRSLADINKIRLAKMNFKAPQINYYGGSCTLICPEETAAIINHLTD
jgi:hypothetical protein